MSSLKKFITEDEIEDKKRKRQEEWEKTRTSEQPLECPEEVVDSRSLYDRLSEQKQKKEDEYEETHRLSNQVKGLEEDEVAFLDHVSQRQSQIEKERKGEETEILQEMQAGHVVTIEEKAKPDKKATRSTQPTKQTRSQNALLAGAVKRKSADSSSDSKRRKNSAEDADQQSSTNLEETEKSTIKGNSPVKCDSSNQVTQGHIGEGDAAVNIDNGDNQVKSEVNSDSRNEVNSDSRNEVNSDSRNEVNSGSRNEVNNDATKQVTQVYIRPSAQVAIGILPGIGGYGCDTSESSNSDSSDIDENTQTQSQWVQVRTQKHVHE